MIYICDCKLFLLFFAFSVTSYNSIGKSRTLFGKHNILQNDLFNISIITRFFWFLLHKEIIELVDVICLKRFQFIVCVWDTNLYFSIV